MTSPQLGGNGSPSAAVPTRQTTSDAVRLCTHRGSETFDVTACDEVLSLSVDGGEISTMLGEVLDDGLMNDFGSGGVSEPGEQTNGLDIVNEDPHWSGASGGHQIDLFGGEVLHRNALRTNVKRVVSMKAWNLANGHHLKSFHVEMMVERMWHDVPSIPASMQIAVALSFKAAASWLLNPFADPWMSSQYVDLHLTAADRARVVGFFETDAVDGARANAAEAAGRQAEAVDLWDAIFRRAASAFH